MCSVCCPAYRRYSAGFRHFAMEAVQFLQLLFVFEPSRCSGLQEKVKAFGLQIVETRQLPTQECRHLSMDVWWRSASEKTFVCRTVAGALTATPTCHSKQFP